MPALRRGLKNALVIGLIASPTLFHFTLFHGGSTVLPVLLLVLQFASISIAVLARAQFRYRWLCAGAIGLIAALLAWRFGAAGITMSTGVTHAILNFVLMGAFGATLLPGREALITQIVRRARGSNFPTEIIPYTRKVTMLWTGFFAAQLLGSLLLFLTQPLAVWSFFINVLNLPLILLLFLAELLYFSIRFRHLPPRDLRDVVRSLSSWRASAAGQAAPRSQ